MQKLPSIELINKEDIKTKSLGEDCAVLFIGGSITLDPKITSLTLDLLDPDIDEVKSQDNIETPEDLYRLHRVICTPDADRLLDFFELCRGCKTLYISDDSELQKAWSIGLGLSVYKTKSSRTPLREVFFSYTSENLLIKPKCLWTVGIFDIQMHLDGALINFVEEYQVTGHIVKVGKVLTAPWQVDF